jgi:hypothetical protein
VAAFRKRLQIAAGHLRCSPDRAAVVRACATAADEICASVAPDLTPDERLAALADRLSVEFSVARTREELDRLAHRAATRAACALASRPPS